MASKILSLIIGLLLLISLTLTSCDTTSDRELRRAEKALDEALDLGADAYATEDYNAADELLQEAHALVKDNKIQASRDAAIRSKLKAEDAKSKAAERVRILNDEADRLGR